MAGLAEVNFVSDWRKGDQSDQGQWGRRRRNRPDKEHSDHPDRDSERDHVAVVA
ncbi:hypothetical protein B0H12DRAFT_1103525 [Mycena haematopus]|nr:hypothetical protein B0H12DRAFT_1103525 [Mycena haematopus]